MSEPFIGQIQPMAFNFPPKGWAQCNGQLMNISQNTALFALLGTTYGGNGVNTFALPNLQSRVPVHFGSFGGDSYFLGEMGGQETVTITTNTMPGHSHTFSGGTADGDRATPVGGAALGKVAGTGGNLFYASDATPQPLDPASLGMAGGTQPHENLQPYLVINWCIAMSGIFPARN